MRREDELVAAVLVALAAVVLHQLADDGALRVPHGEAAAELAREAEQVELGGEPAVVALLGLDELLEVGLQGGVGLPRRAVDALQHRALLVAPPVGAGDLLQLEVTEAARRRHVRALAQVDELGRVAVDADRATGGRPRRCRGRRRRVATGGPHALDDLDLVGLVGEHLEGLVGGHLGAHERLVGGDDLAHPSLDRRQVVVAERAPAGQLEVVVEAVLDRRADRELGAGEQLGDGLGHDVRRRVAQHVAAGVGVVGDDGHAVAVGERPLEVDLLRRRRVGGDGGLGQALADRRRHVRGGRAGGVLAAGTVGEGDRDQVAHSATSLRAAPAPTQVRSPAAGYRV